MDAVPAGETSVAAVVAIIDEFDIDEVIVGLPLQMNGTRGAAAQACEAWAQRLGECTEARITMRDERLTTKQAQRGLHEAGRSVRTSRSVIDSASAVVLLQACLDQYP